MFDHKIKVSTSIVGTTGYNNHAKAFFKELSKYISLEIRNFTIGKSWKGLSPEPHNDEDDIDYTFKKLLVEQTLWNDYGKLQDFPIYQNFNNPGIPTIDLVLETTDHHYFYQSYNKYSIAYSVWESTRVSNSFFNRLLEFDELWVPSKWQMAQIIEQGYPRDKVFVIPEGVDIEVFKPGYAQHTLTKDPNRFTFGLFGRWDYRKSTKEIIETFLKTFDKSEPVDLIVSIDNPFSGDNLQTTENRLRHYDLIDDRIKILSLAPRNEYIDLLKSINVFVSCSRSEGWNLPLIEAMSCGTPSIYSDCCAQLEFAENKGLPVKILGERPIYDSDYNHFNDADGNYYEPDFDDLSRVMRDAYENYKTHQKQALEDAKIIHEKFNWPKIAKDAYTHLVNRKPHIDSILKNKTTDILIKHNLINGPFVNIASDIPGKFKVEFINTDTNNIEYLSIIKNNMWAKANSRYYKNWQIKITDENFKNIIFNETIDLKDKVVMISIDSRSVGDTLAWFPAIEEFRKKHNCIVMCSSFHNDWFINTYPNIKFIEPGSIVDNVYAAYSIGWYYKTENKTNIDGSIISEINIDRDKHPCDPRSQPMQKTAFDILGLDYIETKPILDIPSNVERTNQIAIAIHATAQSKYWNRVNGWQDIVDWCNTNGYEVVLLSNESEPFMGNTHPTGIRQLSAGPINRVINELLKSKAFIGIGSGLSWLSWATNTPTVLISGFSYPYTETQQNTFRVFTPPNKCSGCFNTHRLNQSDWDWCPIHKNSVRQYECTRSITSDEVIAQLKIALNII